MQFQRNQFQSSWLYQWYLDFQLQSGKDENDFHAPLLTGHINEENHKYNTLGNQRIT